MFVLDDLKFLLTITITADNIVENDESFTLTIQPLDPRPGFKPSGGEAVVTILDDDCMGNVLSGHSIYYVFFCYRCCIEF